MLTFSDRQYSAHITNIDQSIIDNFMGLSFIDKLKIFDRILETFDEKKYKRLNRDFFNTFSIYLDERIDLYDAVSEYEYLSDAEKKLLSKQMRLFVKNYSYTVEDDEFGRFKYFVLDEYPDIIKEKLYNRYFNFIKLDSEEIDRFLSNYNELDIQGKFKFIEEFIEAYEDIGSTYYPRYPDYEVILKDTDNIFKEILNEDELEIFNKAKICDKMYITNYILVNYINNIIYNRSTIISSENEEKIIKKRKLKYNNRSSRY